MKEFIGVMKALKNLNRVKILKVLQHGELCVYELQAVLGTSQSSVSKHLAILTEAGLTTRHKEGFATYYHLPWPPRSPYIATLLGNLRFWLEKDDADMAELVKKIPDIRRKKS